MIGQITYNGDGSTRIFPVSFEILGEDYVQVFINNIAISDRTKYDIINNSIVFTAANIPPIGMDNVVILVASSSTEIGDLNTPPSNIQTVLDNLTSINAVVANKTNIDTVSSNTTNVTTVSNNILDINSVVTNIVPNLAEILQADTNATIATTKATEASASATSASTSATTATNQATIATTKASEASASATSASSSAESATTKANEASASATSASNSATTATTKANEASASATAAYNAQLAAEAVFDNFDDKYLGTKATAPTVDNDGNPLVTGALYFRTTAPKGIYVYDAELSAWSIFSYVPTSHGTLSGRSDADSHPMSAITGLDNLLSQKANKATTIAGYGITDAYTKTEVDNSVGALKDVPQNAKTAAYTLTLTDRGKSIDVSTGGITITVPLNSAVAFPIGATVSITNLAATAITISSSATLRQAGTANTGSRTLAAYGMATLRKVATDTWFISGAGLS